MQEITTFLGNHLALSIATLVVFILVSIMELARARGKAFHLSPTDAVTKINHDNAVIVDIRAEAPFRSAHIIGAQRISADEIHNNNKKLEKYRSRPLIFVCATGMESQKMAAFMLKNGYNAYAITGGMRGWSNADMPTVKGD